MANDTPGEAFEAVCPSPTLYLPFPTPLFCLVVPELYPFITILQSSK